MTLWINFQIVYEKSRPLEGFHYVRVQALRATEIH